MLITHSHPDHFGAAERLRLAADADLVTADNFRTWFDLLEPDVDLEIESRFDGDRQAAAVTRGWRPLRPDGGRARPTVAVGWRDASPTDALGAVQGA